MAPDRLRVLVACEFTGRTRDAFLRHGHDATSIDLLPTETKGPHIQANVIDYLSSKHTPRYDLLVAFPPCTYLANSGVRWIEEDRRRDKMLEAVGLFNFLLYCPIGHIAIENPVQHKYAREYIRKYDQIVHPFHFGDPFRKKTCFWTKNLPPLVPTAPKMDESDISSSIARLPDSKTRQSDRSRTPPGLAEAIAVQWGFHARVAARQFAR